ncbi:MAG TPA: hypothetical protein DEA08_19685 [Planctomycetes bacterium]|nr:hypothetical protein [Planctomycetota bacterium]
MPRLHLAPDPHGSADRWHLGGVPLHCGDGLELALAGGRWIPCRFELRFTGADALAKGPRPVVHLPLQGADPGLDAEQLELRVPGRDAEQDLEQRVARWSDALELSRLSGDELEALRLAVGRARHAQGWGPWPGHGDLGAESLHLCKAPQVQR